MTEPGRARLVVTIDCADPDRLADFWCAALGYERTGGVEQFRAISPTDASVLGPKVLFQGVPEPKATKNRIHLDIDLAPGVPLESELDRVVALGASVVGEGPTAEFGLRWQVMADPEGNEFCIVAQPPPE